MLEPTCPICEEPVLVDSDGISFGAVGGTENHSFYGATAHRRCLNSWEQRDALVRYWNDALARNPQGGMARLVVNENGEVRYNVEQQG